MIPQGVRRKNKLSWIFPTFIFLLLFFNTFILTDIEPYNYYAKYTYEYTFYVGLIYFIYISIRNRFSIVQLKLLPKEIKFFYLSVLTFSLGMIGIHIVNGNYNDNTELVGLLLYLVFFIAMVQFKWNKSLVVIFAILATLLLMTLFPKWINSSFSDTFINVFRNPNIAGIYYLCLLFFPIIGLKYFNKIGKLYLILGMIAGLLLIYSSTSRAVMLLLMVVVGARIVLCFSKRLFRYLFWVLMVINGLFLCVYSLLPGTNIAIYINKWSQDVFEKRLFSGREEIWSSSIQFGIQNPWFGKEIGISPKEFIENTHYIHTHNQYLQIFLESGLIGIILFVLFLYGIWKLMIVGITNSVIGWAACFYLGILFYQNFEITLFFNLGSIGLIHWFIIACGISNSINFFNSKKSI